MTDNDRELIELAAKAFGFSWVYCPDGCDYANVYDENDHHSLWNPLTEDDDAFRLMVACQLSVTPCCGSTYVDAGGMLDFSHVHDVGETAAAGTRRAIVMMAAEIGRGMKDA